MGHGRRPPLPGTCLPALSWCRRLVSLRMKVRAEGATCRENVESAPILLNPSAGPPGPEGDPAFPMIRGRQVAETPALAGDFRSIRNARGPTSFRGRRVSPLELADLTLQFPEDVEDLVLLGLLELSPVLQEVGQEERDRADGEPDSTPTMQSRRSCQPDPGRSLKTRSIGCAPGGPSKAAIRKYQNPKRATAVIPKVTTRMHHPAKRLGRDSYVT